MKIKVPDKMLAAVDEALDQARMTKASRSAMAEGNPELWAHEIKLISVEAALLYLSAGCMELPLSLLKDTLAAVPGWKLNETVVQDVLHQGLRRMFLEPEPAAQSFDTPYGRFEVDERVPPGEIRLYDWSGPVLVKNLRTPEHIAEHERGEQPLSPTTVDNLLWDDWHRNRGVPEEVNGILVIQSHNAQVEEAFRRGQRSAEVKPNPTTIG